MECLVFSSRTFFINFKGKNGELFKLFLHYVYLSNPRTHFDIFFVGKLMLNILKMQMQMYSSICIECGGHIGSATGSSRSRLYESRLYESSPFMVEESSIAKPGFMKTGLI